MTYQIRYSGGLKPWSAEVIYRDGRCVDLEWGETFERCIRVIAEHSGKDIIISLAVQLG